MLVGKEKQGGVGRGDVTDKQKWRGGDGFLTGGATESLGEACRARGLPSHIWHGTKYSERLSSIRSLVVSSRLSYKTSKLPMSSTVLQSVLKAGPRMQTIRKTFHGNRTSLESKNKRGT